MANLYGVANAPPIPILVNNLGSLITIPANVPTAFYTTAPLVAPSQGYFYALVWLNLIVLSGATVNTGMQFYYAIGAGSNVATASMGAYGLVANTNNYISVAFPTIASQTAWQGAGSTLTFSMNAAGFGVQLEPLCNVCFGLFRAPDQ